MRLRIPVLLLAAACAFGAEPFRPPSAPLIAHDPYFSVWSASDRLAGDATKHWTGAAQELTSFARIDGKPFRLMGAQQGRGGPAALPQTALRVYPARTVYEFEGEGVRLAFTFLTPALPRDLDVLSRPVTYLVWEAKSADGREHAVSVYFDASSTLAVNVPEQTVAWSRLRAGDLSVLRMGTVEQPVLAKSGDNLRIDWGYFYLAAPPAAGASTVATDRGPARGAFLQSGRLPDADDFEPAQIRRNRVPVLAAAFDFGRVGAAPAERHLLVAYDDLYSIEYLQRRLRPYWRRNGMTASELLQTAEREYSSLAARTKAFDEELMADLQRAGRDEYAQLAALAYRQTLAAHKIAADIDGSPLMFPKENFSNGCIGTVDVIYPSSPFFLLFSPEMLKAQLRPVLDYSALPRWKFPFAPHDLGTYPLANGQVYGGGERTEDNQMPVEESGNMLIMLAALARIEGNAHFAAKYWPSIARWAEYLKQKGLDPENQLSTDDFAGHLAHNANLSIKAILALRSYALLAEMTGHAAEARQFQDTARGFATRWVELARDGGHYKLAFDKPGTWSQKYNLVWDRLLGFNLFPADIARTEMAFYKTKQNAFGLPLDNRALYTKLDWIVWTATLAESDADFRMLVGPAYRFANETPDRVPLSDWYWTQDAKQRGFQARSVVGGVFIKMLAEPAIWKKWARAAN